MGFAPATLLAQTQVAEGEFDASSYYIFSAPGISWIDAKAWMQNPDNFECGIAGVEPHLATLTRAEEDEFVLDVARGSEGTLTGAPLTGEFWIGGSQIPNDPEDPNDPAFTDPRANWFWENNEGPIPGTNRDPDDDQDERGYRNWDDDEPNDNPAGDPTRLEQHLGAGFNNKWNDERSLGNIQGFAVECDYTINNGNEILDGTAGDGYIRAVTQEIIALGTMTATSCKVQKRVGNDKNPNSKGPVTGDGTVVDLVDVIRKTPECGDLWAALQELPNPQARLEQYQEPADVDGNFVVTLVQSRIGGQLADITNGIDIQEENPVPLLGSEPSCETDSVENSPFTCSVDLSTPLAYIDKSCRFTTATCNRSRTGTRKSSQLYVYPLVNASNKSQRRQQVSGHADILDSAISSYMSQGCVDTGFLTRVSSEFAAARSNFLSNNTTAIKTGIEELHDLTVLLLNIGDFDPYRVDPTDPASALCPNEPKGELGSLSLNLTYYVWRSLLYPNSFGGNVANADYPAGDPWNADWEGPYQFPVRIQCLLPAFDAGSVPAACLDPATVTPAPYPGP